MKTGGKKTKKIPQKINSRGKVGSGCGVIGQMRSREKMRNGRQEEKRQKKSPRKLILGERQEVVRIIYPKLLSPNENQ